MNEFSDYGLIENNECYYKENYALSRSMIQKFEQVFLDIKNDKKFLRSNKGKIHVPHIIDFKTNKSNFKVFRKELVQQSGLIILLVDISGSMNNNNKIVEVRNLVANLMTSVESSPKIELRVFTFEGGSDPVYDQKTGKHTHTRDLLYMNEIKTVKNCDQIVAGGSSPTDKAIHYVTKQFEKSRKNKTLLVLTDGSPNSCSTMGSSQRSLLETKKVLVKSESNKFNIFGCGFGVSNHLDQIMENSFRGNYINLHDINDIEKYLFTALSSFVRSIKNV
tara:strand:+ start:57 stop:887 length:831 start_codon:yes stop_codon:yes gene_type:complete